MAIIWLSGRGPQETLPEIRGQLQLPGGVSSWVLARGLPSKPGDELAYLKSGGLLLLVVGRHLLLRHFGLKVCCRSKVPSTHVFTQNQNHDS